MRTKVSLSPVFRYQNIDQGAKWLSEAFGFETEKVATDSDGRTNYVSLKLGDNIVLLGRRDSAAFDRLMVQPNDIGGMNTQSCYISVEDIDKHYARVKDYGAKIEIAPEADGQGGKFYACRDSENHLWTFGTLNFSNQPVVEHSSKQKWKPRVGLFLSAVLIAMSGLAFFERDSIINAFSTDAALTDERKLRQLAESNLKLRSEELQEVHIENSELKELLESKSVELTNLTRATTNLKKSIEDYDSQENELRKARSDLITAKKHVAKAEAQKQNAISEVATANAANREAQLKAEQALAEKNKAFDKVNEIKTISENERKVRIADKQKIAELTEKISLSDKMLQEKIQSSDRQHQEAAERFKIVTAELKKVKGELAIASNRANTATNENLKLKNSLEQKGEALNTVEQQKLELSEEKEAVASLRNQIRELKEKQDKENLEFRDALKREKASVTNANTKITTLNEKIKVFEIRTQRLTIALKTKSEQLSAFKEEQRNPKLTTIKLAKNARKKNKTKKNIAIPSNWIKSEKFFVRNGKLCKNYTYKPSRCFSTSSRSTNAKIELRGVRCRVNRSGQIYCPNPL